MSPRYFFVLRLCFRGSFYAFMFDFAAYIFDVCIVFVRALFTDS
ncbi:hypothetical protein CAMSH0001_1448 [Campylobacter showae RM3277]|uniref:Uncharacterized protein n=1 Tax=Campylobacter showae RM3277 TaxID=553219 RepID=C6RIV1_9BACT|nr:hypothetical protein CAMSH0001_1448 [Campylobacter showae RM3277]